MNLLTIINDAFHSRQHPSAVVAKEHSETYEYEEALHFEKRDWNSINCEELSQFSDAVIAFTPEAFCYFLPGILSAGIRENRPDLLVNGTLIGMLDRSPNIAYWDNFFVDRWSLLNRKECEAVQQWTLWLSSSNTGIFTDDSLMRAYETLDILIDQNEQA